MGEMSTKKRSTRLRFARRPEYSCTSPTLGTTWTWLYASGYLVVEYLFLLGLCAVKFTTIFDGDCTKPVGDDSLVFCLLMSVTSIAVSWAAIQGIRERYALLVVPFAVYHFFHIYLTVRFIVDCLTSPEKVRKDTGSSFSCRFPAVGERVQASDIAAFLAVVITVLAFVLIMRFFFMAMTFICFWELMGTDEEEDGKRGEENCPLASAEAGEASKSVSSTSTSVDGTWTSDSPLMPAEGSRTDDSTA